MNFDLTEDQLAFQQAARDFAAGELAPHAAKWDAESIFPVATIAAAGQLGFCGLYAAEAHGGLGLPRLDATLVFEELAAACPSTTAYITIHNMATWMITNWARPEVAAAWGPQLAARCQLRPPIGGNFRPGPVGDHPGRHVVDGDVRRG